jgi:hypothetical protein
MDAVCDKDQLLRTVSQISTDLLFLAHDLNTRGVGFKIKRRDRLDLRFAALLLQHVHKLIGQIGTSPDADVGGDDDEGLFSKEENGTIPPIPQFN